MYLGRQLVLERILGSLGLGGVNAAPVRVIVEEVGLFGASCTRGKSPLAKAFSKVDCG